VKSVHYSGSLHECSKDKFVFYLTILLTSGHGLCNSAQLSQTNSITNNIYHDGMISRCQVHQSSESPTTLPTMRSASHCAGFVAAMTFRVENMQQRDKMATNASFNLFKIVNSKVNSVAVLMPFSALGHNKLDQVELKIARSSRFIVHG
jgi:hypothetical protein